MDSPGRKENPDQPTFCRATKEIEVYLAFPEPLVPLDPRDSTAYQASQA